MGGCSLSTIGLDSLAEYSVSHSHTHKQKERIDKLSSKDSAFDREITLHLISFVSFCEPSVRCCSSERCTSVAFLPAYLFPTHTTSGRRCCSREPKDKKMANVCSSHSEKMCVQSQRGTDDSLCFQQRALRPFEGGEGSTDSWISGTAADSDWLLLRAVRPCLCSLPVHPTTNSSSLSSHLWRRTRQF